MTKLKAVVKNLQNKVIQGMLSDAVTHLTKSNVELSDVCLWDLW